MLKKRHRQAALQKRFKTNKKDIALFSGRITDRLLELECVKNASCVMAFWPHMNEPDLKIFIRKCIESKKKVLLPKVLEKSKMIAVDYSEESKMKKNKYGIMEPAGVYKSEYNPDVIIVPGIVFDKNLHRIGFGGGYYDRFLKQVNAVKVGVCFESHIIDDIKAHDFDVPMDMVVTQDRILGAVKCAL